MRLARIIPVRHSLERMPRAAEIFFNAGRVGLNSLTLPYHFGLADGPV